MAGRARAILNGSSFIPLRVSGAAAALDLDFTTRNYVGISGESAFTVTRTGIATSGLSTDATGSSYTVFAPNTPRIVTGSGLLVEWTRTQYLGASDTPATQTTASLGTGTYCLWVIGTGSATPSAGTATITGAAAATAGSPNVFTVTVAGTVTVTVSGSLTRFQLENSAYPTSYIPNLGAAGTSVTRSTDSVALTSTNFSSWFNASAGTFYAQAGSAPANEAGAARRIANINDGTESDRITLAYAGAAGISAGFITDGGAAQANYTAPATPYTPTAKLSIAYAVNDVNFAVNGVAGTQDTSATLPTVNQLRFGDVVAGGSGPQNIMGFIRRVAYFNTRLSDANLQALTA